MTNLNDNTAHDFSMYYPKGQNGNILNTNSKSKKKKSFDGECRPTKKRRVIRLESLEVSLSFFSGILVYVLQKERGPQGYSP